MGSEMCIRDSRKGYGQTYHKLDFGHNYVFYIPRIREFFRIRHGEYKQVSRNCQELGSSLHGNNGPQRAEICGTSFIIITLSYDSCPNVVFTRHSCFPDCKVPRVYLENLSETPTRGRTEESRRYYRLMEHVVYTGLKQC